MKLHKCIKKSFAVIGKEGSTSSGVGFVKKLWKDANSHFDEIEGIAKKDAHGNIMGIWGAMTDFSREYKPWKNNFSRGLYLAGIECPDDAEPPEGWTKWVIPSYEYIYVENESDDTFRDVIDYMGFHGIPLVASAHDFNSPKSGRGYIFFPIRKL